MFENFGEAEIIASLFSIKKQGYLQRLLHGGAPVPETKVDALFNDQWKVFETSLPPPPQPTASTPYYWSPRFPGSLALSIVCLAYDFSSPMIILIAIIIHLKAFLIHKKDQRQHLVAPNQEQKNYEQQLKTYLKQAQEDYRKNTGPRLVRIITLEDEKMKLALSLNFGLEKESASTK